MNTKDSKFDYIIDLQFALIHFKNDDEHKYCAYWNLYRENEDVLLCDDCPYITAREDYCWPRFIKHKVK